MQNISNLTFGTNSTNFEILQRQSIYLLGIVNGGSSQSLVCLSMIGFLSGFIIFTTIFWTKSLRTKNYILIASVALGDMILASTIMSMGIRRLISSQTNSPMISNQVQCLLQDGSRVLGIALINSFFLGCAVDRFIAVSLPHWYSKVYPNWLFYVGVGFTYVRAVSEPLLLFIGTSNEIFLPICAYTFASTAASLDAQATRSNIVLCFICIVYASTMVVVYIRLGKVKKHHGNISEAKKQMQTKVIHTLAVMLSGYVCTVVASSILYRFTVKQIFEVQLKYGALGFAFQEVSAACNFTILFWKNKEFRSAVFDIFRYKNKIVPTLSIGASKDVGNLSTYYNKFNIVKVKPMRTSFV